MKLEFQLMFSVFFLLVLSGPIDYTEKDSNVYLCMGKSSKRYHYRQNCRGLSNCSTKIYEVSLSKAKELGRTLCGFEE